MIQEAWIGGVSTRRVDELVQAMGLSGISKSQVSKLCKDIDERVNAFLERPLEGEWPYLWLDATYLKVREGGRIVSVAAIIAVAVDHRRPARDRRPRASAPPRPRPFWTTFLKGLVKRGLKGVKLVISDAHEGLQPRDHPRARGHVAALPRPLDAQCAGVRAKGQHTMVAAAIRQAFLQPEPRPAHQTWRQVADQLRPRWPKLAALMDDSEHDVLAYMAFPLQHRTKLHSTNPLERLNKEVKRRADVVGIFPNEASMARSTTSPNLSGGLCRGSAFAEGSDGEAFSAGAPASLGARWTGRGAGHMGRREGSRVADCSAFQATRTS